MNAKQKLKGRAGFSLAETMLAVLILLLVSGIVAAGIPAAKNAYEKVIIASNAQALLSTTATALRDELGTAWDVRIDDDAAKTTGSFVTYNSADTGNRSRLFEDATGIKLLEYNAVTGLNVNAGSYLTDARLLVPAKAGPGAYSESLVVTYGSGGIAKVEEGGGVYIVISDLNVKNGENVLASLDALKIRVFSEEPAT